MLHHASRCHCMSGINSVPYVLLRRRYYVHGSDEPLRPVSIRLAAVILTSLAFSTSFTQKAPLAVPIVFLGLW
jgi:APA family basic amino acid/polyamine antiporter